MLGQVVIENGVKKIKPLTADAGSGVALGMIVPFFIKRERSGYLFCDGSRFDTTKYPLLYAELGTDILPDCREVGLTGAEKNTTYIFDSTETDPRTGQAGTQNHDVFTQGEFKDDQVQEHYHNIGTNDTTLDYSGTTATTGQNLGGFYIGGTELKTRGESGRKGTVTRGKSLAVYWYIKATSGLSENAQDNVVAQLNEERSYSTSEVNTGKKWIDGKPIYRIVFHSATNWADGTKIGTISNLDYVISIKNLSISDTNFSYENYGTNGNYISLATVKTNGEVYINRGSSFNNSKPSSVIVEYTKTTDV